MFGVRRRREPVVVCRWQCSAKRLNRKTQHVGSQFENNRVMRCSILRKKEPLNETKWRGGGENEKERELKYLGTNTLASDVMEVEVRKRD